MTLRTASGKIIYISWNDIKVEGRDPTKFVEGWLLELFGKEAFTPLYLETRPDHSLLDFCLTGIEYYA